MTEPTQPVVTRFAPSPTGHLHIGGARTALFNWALARRLGGHFLLRIEDTDQSRDAGPESVLGILRGLHWLGLEWDEGPAPDLTLDRDPRGVGPFFQSRRRAGYDAALQRLLDADLAYHAFETPAELAVLRDEAKREKRPFRYNRAALDIPRAERFSRAETEPHVVRFRTPDEEVVVRDEVLGEVRLAPGEIDDFIIVKADGFPTYHFAVVVDDEAMGVTHVVRGQEHLINTPRHVLLQRALGYRTPVYAHLPLIVSPSGAKMSKRDKDRVVRQACRDAGISEPPPGTVEPAEFTAWLKDKNRQMAQGALSRLAAALGVTVPRSTLRISAPPATCPRSWSTTSRSWATRPAVISKSLTWLSSASISTSPASARPAPASTIRNSSRSTPTPSPRCATRPSRSAGARGAPSSLPRSCARRTPRKP